MLTLGAAKGSLILEPPKVRSQRVWDLQKKERLFQWKDFAGASIYFDDLGERILAITTQGQPNLIDLWRNQNLYLENLKTPCQHAMFTVDGRGIIAAGYGGFYLIDIYSGRVVNGFNTKGGQIIDIAVSPDGQGLATITTRSIHIFSLFFREIQIFFVHRSSGHSRRSREAMVFSREILN